MKNEDDDFGWGVVVNFSKKSNVKVRYPFHYKYVYLPAFSENKIKILFSL